MDRTRNTDDGFRPDGERLRNRLARLIAADTSNPPGEERLVADILEAELAPLGVAVERHEKEPGRTNLLARFGRAEPGAFRLAVVAHADTVPAGEDWTTPPFELTERDGMWYGRGVTDNKGPLAAAVEAFLLVREACPDLPGELVLVSAADEECGSALGAEYLLAEGILDCDAALVPDVTTRLAAVDVAEKGILQLTVRAAGRQAHASIPEKGANAVTATARLLTELEDYRPTPTEHPVLERPTMNIGVVSGGSAPNMVPARCETRIDFRLLPGSDPDDVVADVERIAAGVSEARPGVSFEVTRDMWLPPTDIDPDHEFVVALLDTVEAVTGERPATFGLGGVTICKQFLRRGIPAAAVAPGGPDVPHIADEHVSPEELLDFADIAARLAVRSCGGAP